MTTSSPERMSPREEAAAIAQGLLDYLKTTSLHPYDYRVAGHPSIWERLCAGFRGSPPRLTYEITYYGHTAYHMGTRSALEVDAWVTTLNRAFQRGWNKEVLDAPEQA